MRFRHAVVVCAPVVVVAGVLVTGVLTAGGSVSGQEPVAAADGFTAPMTSWGDPDLAGIWSPGYTLTPLERPDEYEGREFLTDEEVAELGPLLRRTADAIRCLLHPDQVYVCLWSHAGWKPGHIHFVLQPVSADMRERYPRQGPSLQAAMADAGDTPPREEVERFADQARELMSEPEE